jgi:hypothetical protein
VGKQDLAWWGIAVVLLLLVSLAAIDGHRSSVTPESHLAEQPPPEQLAEEVGSDLDLPTIDGKVAAPRSSRWKSFRDAFVADHPECEACGARYRLNVHHVIPFHERPDLELEESNLIVLCVSPDHNCHFLLGHDPDGPNGPEKPDWKKSNPNVREDAEAYRRYSK